MLVARCGLAVLLLLAGRTAGGPARHCASPTGSLDGHLVVEGEGGDRAEFTTISWQVGLGETLCYKFEGERAELGGTVELTYLSLRSVYSVMDSYKFWLAASRVSCLCDCPGGASHCSPHSTKLCGNTTNCAEYYNPSVESAGCVLSWLSLSAALCCSIQAVPQSRQTYRALHLSVPAVLAQFRTVYRDREGVVVDSREYSVDLNTGTTIGSAFVTDWFDDSLWLDWDVSVVVSSPGPTTLLPPGWYTNPDLSHTLLAGLHLNTLDGWDVTKLGWLKADGRGEPATASLEQLASSFSAAVDSCGQGEHSGSFAPETRIDGEGVGGREVTQLYPFLRSSRVWRRHVELEHSESPLLSLTLQHSNRVGVVVQYSASQLLDFTGLLYRDSASHTHLNLSLVGAAGTLTGLVSGAGAVTQSVLLRLPPAPANSTHRVKLRTDTACQAGQISLTLRPLAPHNNTAVTKLLPCVTRNLRTFRSAPPRLASLADTVDRVDCLGCSAAWLHWLDPRHWLDSVWPQSRVVILLTSLAVLLVIIFLLCRVTNSLCRCCGCSTSKK